MRQIVAKYPYGAGFGPLIIVWSVPAGLRERPNNLNIFIFIKAEDPHLRRAIARKEEVQRHSFRYRKIVQRNFLLIGESAFPAALEKPNSFGGSGSTL